MHRIGFLLASLWIGCSCLTAGERFASNPPLLNQRQLPPPQATANSNKIGLPPEKAETAAEPKTAAGQEPAAEKNQEDAEQPRHRRGWFGRGRSQAKSEKDVPEEKDAPEPLDKRNGQAEPREQAGKGETRQTGGSEQETMLYDTAEAMAMIADTGPPPTPTAVEEYRSRLEMRLLEKYNNTPEYGGKVAQVTVVLSRPLETSIDGNMIRAEFDQLVYDYWGKRLPALEKEYFVVTFGSGGVQQVRSDPSIRVGLDMEKTYSERAPLAADPFKNVEDSEAFKSTPKAKMPGWWRPDFPELD